MSESCRCGEPATPDIVAGLVIRPGDRVLIGLGSHGLAFHQLDQMHQKLRERFPDAEFTIMGGVTNLAVSRADE